MMNKNGIDLNLIKNQLRSSSVGGIGAFDK